MVMVDEGYCLNYATVLGGRGKRWTSLFGEEVVFWAMDALRGCGVCGAWNVLRIGHTRGKSFIISD